MGLQGRLGSDGHPGLPNSPSRNINNGGVYYGGDPSGYGDHHGHYGHHGGFDGGGHMEAVVTMEVAEVAADHYFPFHLRQIFVDESK